MKSLNLLTLATVVCFFNITPLFAQPSFEYHPAKDDSTELAKLKTDIRKRFEKDSAGITGENKKYLLKIYRERFDAINEMFSNNEIILSADVNAYLNKLVNEVIAKNPELKSLGTRFVFDRAYWPNAASFGEGTIIYNIGLFSKLQNEAQVIFALCHELSHLYLDHGNKAITQYVNTVYSDEFQEKLKEIKKTEYERNREADKLIKGLAFKNRRHGREHESEADSLALVFMKNTLYDTKEAIGCLGMLDNIDKDVFDTEKGLEQFFNFSEYPFKKRWTRKEQAFFGVTAETKITDKEEDSLKTHPDCKVRIARLSPAVQKISNSNGQKFLLGQTEFEKMQELFRYEAIEFCYQSKRISRCLYLSLELLQQKKGDPYLVGMIGKCLDAMYANQKNHTLNKVVDLPSPLAEKNYNLLLEFIQKVSLTDIAALDYYFLKQYQQQFTTNEDFVYALVKSKENFDMPAEKKEWQDYYLKTFSKPKYKF